LCASDNRWLQKYAPRGRCRRRKRDGRMLHEFIAVVIGVFMMFYLKPYRKQTEASRSRLQLQRKKQK
jgi:hypothetical protein